MVWLQVLGEAMLCPPKTTWMWVQTMKSAPVAARPVVQSVGAESPSTRNRSGGPPPKVTVAKPVVREIVEQDQYTGRFDAIDYVEVRAREKRKR